MVVTNTSLVMDVKFCLTVVTKKKTSQGCTILYEHINTSKNSTQNIGHNT